MGTCCLAPTERRTYADQCERHNACMSCSSPVAGRRAANELAAEDAVAGLMALSNEQIQGAGVDNDSTAWFAG
ncbi:hypothetical protein EE612_058683 [Oryza sativa]|nr:hypothetical protein EE612_058683 [Oryza sativa]